MEGTLRSVIRVRKVLRLTKVCVKVLPRLLSVFWLWISITRQQALLVAAIGGRGFVSEAPRSSLHSCLARSSSMLGLMNDTQRPKASAIMAQAVKKVAQRRECRGASTT